VSLRETHGRVCVRHPQEFPADGDGSPFNQLEDWTDG
jgi:hypothetical protein